ncbi:MAG: hypothetical protein JWO38_5708 [Gemmataceae bacterium]|nr:hypothetical protein [Gemmataceae bacterium]
MAARWPGWAVAWDRDGYEAQLDAAGGVLSFPDRPADALLADLVGMLVREPGRSPADTVLWFAEREREAGKSVELNPLALRDDRVELPRERKAEILAQVAERLGLRLPADDPVRAALEVLGVELPTPGKWMSAAYLAGAVTDLRLTGRPIPKDDRESPSSRQQALSKVLDVYAEETFVAETRDGAVRLRLDRRRTVGEDGRMVTWYRFSVLGPVTGGAG